MVVSLIHQLSLFHFYFCIFQVAISSEKQTAVEFIIQDKINNQASAFSSRNSS